MKKLAILFAVFVIMISACSAGKPSDKFSLDDMAIVKVGSGKKVKYGMSRAEAEEVLGSGSKSEMLYTVDYPQGVSLFYRNDTVAGIILTSDSKGVYKTERGAETGMPKEKIEKLYGDQHTKSESGRNLDYVYNAKDEKFLINDLPKNEDEAHNTYVISATFDDNGYSERIFLMDAKYAIYLN